ncbi:MAG: PKD domain-containing protein [Bacteroidetes bacterium]|nr:PKD domain-containing protein [Bacteroidota bacterium]
MKKVLLLVSVLWLSLGSVYAQVDRCGTMANHAQLLQEDPSYGERRDAIEQMIQKRMANDKSWRTSGVITIPVVFHVLYSTNNTTQNITLARIQAQLDVLNQDYSATNVDVSSVPSVFQPLVGNSGIQFCLAVRDPNGNTTDGIIRKQTSTTSFNTSNGIKFDAQGGDNAWPSSSYLNIWVGNLSGGLLGYAQFPGGSAATDGVVLLNGSVGGPGALGTAAPYNRGRTATHEIGHWLNLLHIWGDDGNGCSGTDNVADTPNQADENYGCPSFPNISCSNGPNGEMYMNYMDYTDDACMFMFTLGQSTRMNTSLTTTRASLLTSQGCVPVTVGAPAADFVASSTSLSVGGSTNFTDLSSGSPTTWSWTFTGGTPGTSTTQNPANITYAAAGTYAVSLTVTNASGNDTETKNGYIVVTAAGGSGCDTITNFPATGTPTVFSSSGWGYVCGHNDYLDIAKADQFSQPVTPTYQITGALLGFAVATASNLTNTFTVKVWNNGGAAGSPGTSLGSVDVTYNTAQTDATAGNLTYASFTAPITPTSPYYLGIEFGYVAGDTLAFVSTADGEVTPGTAWEQFSSLDWHAMSETPTSWGLNLAQGIFPILCSPNSLNDPAVSGIVVAPNPTSGQLIIHNLNNTTNGAVVNIMNVMGQVVMSNTITNFTGTHYVDMSQLSNGLYFVEVSTGSTKVNHRIILNK